MSREITHYLGTPVVGQYGSVAESGPPAGGDRPAGGSGALPGVAIMLDAVVCRGGQADTSSDSTLPGITLAVPAGQSLALVSQPRGTATEVFDLIAGLGRPRTGHVSVDGVEVSRLSGAELDRYRARRGLVSPRFPLLPSLSVIDNVLAAPPAGRVSAPSAERGAERAVRMLELTGASELTGAVHRLSAEDHWRIMIARALLPSPRLLLAENPPSSLDSRAADRILDVLMDAHAMFGFTLVLTADRPATAVRCQRRVLIANGAVAEDDITSGDDPWTRGRVDRIG
jgi:putative ABC transport system ATP-binding protein